ncbi:hypothetical protein [Streptomyces sp. NPDC006610]|uniref:hypothetical protein n=1 Tax=Streptomyces sp. NPDC006610 TaxID=3154584 RepID=UPI00339FA36C
MHRTTTTAALLVTVAASALSGCVTVQRPPTPARTLAPGPDERVKPQIVQAPAREALELIGPSGPPGRAAPGADRPAPAARPSADGKPPADGEPSPARSPRTESRPDDRPAHPEPQRPRRPSGTRAPAASQQPREGSGICGLGRTYGGWHPDSPQSTICDGAYGR